MKSYPAPESVGTIAGTALFRPPRGTRNTVVVVIVVAFFTNLSTYIYIYMYMITTFQKKH